MWHDILLYIFCQAVSRKLSGSNYWDILAPSHYRTITVSIETIQKRSEILGLNIFQKIHLGETRPLIKHCMPKLDFERKHYLRSKGGYIPFKNFWSKFKSSFFPYHSEIWSTLPKNIQTVNNLNQHKFSIGHAGW